MTYQLNFAALWPYLPELLSGLLTTIELTVMATIGALHWGSAGCDPLWQHRDIAASLGRLCGNCP